MDQEQQANGSRRDQFTRRHLICCGLIRPNARQQYDYDDPTPQGWLTERMDNPNRAAVAEAGTGEGGERVDDGPRAEWRRPWPMLRLH